MGSGRPRRPVVVVGRQPGANSPGVVYDDAPRPDPRGADRRPPAHFVTINPDGSPHLTIVRIGLEGDEIVSGHLPLHRKLRNVQRDPRVSLSIEVGGHNEMGLANYLVVEGDGAHHRRRRRRPAPTAGYRLHRAGRSSHRLTTRRPATSCGSRPHRVRGDQSPGPPTRRNEAADCVRSPPAGRAICGRLTRTLPRDRIGQGTEASPASWATTPISSGNGRRRRAATLEEAESKCPRAGAAWPLGGHAARWVRG